jgi:hypothetical protein
MTGAAAPPTGNSLLKAFLYGILALAGIILLGLGFLVITWRNSEKTTSRRESEFKPLAAQRTDD